MPPRIVIAAGGTAGHVVPALAVADALRADGADVVFVGGERAEAELVPAAGYELRPIRAQGLHRSNPLKAARAAGVAMGALVASGRILRELAPAAVMGGGGYVAGPVGLAATMRGVPLVLTEADSHLGLTNRLLAGRARRVCLAFPIAGREPPHYRVTGRPSPPAEGVDRAAARAEYGVADGEHLLLVFGGSLGARSINGAAPEAFAAAPFRVLHIAGARDFESVASPGPHYDLRAYLDSAAFTRALSASDLVVARSGGSIHEVTARGRPAVLIPYPHASADHQTANARWMADAGGAVILPDAQLSPARLRAEVDGILGDPDRLEAMSRASAALARPDAAREVAAEVLAAADARPGGE